MYDVLFLQKGTSLIGSLPKPQFGARIGIIKNTNKPIEKKSKRVLIPYTLSKKKEENKGAVAEEKDSGSESDGETSTNFFSLPEKSPVEEQTTLVKSWNESTISTKPLTVEPSASLSRTENKLSNAVNSSNMCDNLSEVKITTPAFNKAATIVSQKSFQLPNASKDSNTASSSGTSVANKIYKSYKSAPVTGPYSGETVTGPYTETSVTGPYIENSVTGPYIENSVTGPYIENSVTGPYIGNSVTGPYVGQSVTGPYINKSVIGPYPGGTATGAYDQSVTGPYGGPNVPLSYQSADTPSHNTAYGSYSGPMSSGYLNPVPTGHYSQYGAYVSYYALIQLKYFFRYFYIFKYVYCFE